MILTVTPNTAIDWTVFLPHFRWEGPLRAEKAVWGMAGRPSGAAWILGELGVNTTAMGFAAGTSGEKMIELLESKNVETDFIWVSGETRLNVHVVDRSTGGQTLLAVDTLEISSAHVERFMKRFQKKLGQAAVLVTGSSLPACINDDFFRVIIQAAKEKAVPVVLDTSSSHLAQALSAGPDVIKTTSIDLAIAAGQDIITIQDAYQAARAVMNQYDTQVVVTLDDEDTLVVLKGKAFHIPAPRIEKIESTAGTGDGILAGIAYALANRLPLEDGARLGTAAAGAVTLTPATADCRREDIERLLPSVELTPYP